MKKSGPSHTEFCVLLTKTLNFLWSLVFENYAFPWLHDVLKVQVRPDHFSQLNPKVP